MYQEFLERGFNLDIFGIETNYSMDGNYYSFIKIDAASNESHPMYTMYYVTGSDENTKLYTINSVNDNVTAYPVTMIIDKTYQEAFPNMYVLLSETDTITSYDSEANKFYERIATESDLIIVKVDRIDAAFLDALTVETLIELMRNLNT